MKVSLAYLVITTALLAVFYQQLLGQLLAGTAPLLFVSEDAALINEAIPTVSAVLFRWVLAMMVVNVLVTTVVGIYITRRLGQPLMAIKRCLREIGAGNLNVQLRASDARDFAEITQELMDAMATVRHNVAAAKQEVAGSDGTDGTASMSPPDAHQALQNCKRALDYFQVDAEAGNDADNSRAA